MRITTLFTGVIATTNAAVTYQFIQRARLDAIFYSCFMLATAGGPTNGVFEFSLQSTGQTATNDPIGTFATIRVGTLAASQANINEGLITPIGMQFQPVDRIYINAAYATAPAGAGCSFTLIQN